MSRTYQALQKAEAEEKQAPRAPAGTIPVDGQEAPEIHWDMEVSCRAQYQKIRVWLVTPPTGGKRPQTVMVVACRAGAGSTTTAASLAATLVEGQKLRVLLIDGNFRTPSLNQVFQTANNGGFSEVVSEGIPFEAYLQPTHCKNLCILTSGRIPICPAEAFEGEAIDQLLSQLKQQFDFIIFDAAPVLEFPDSYALARRVDGIVMIVEAEKTSLEDARKAKRNLELAGGRILGVVLNRQRNYMPTLVRRFFGPLY